MHEAIFALPHAAPKGYLFHHQQIQESIITKPQVQQIASAAVWHISKQSLPVIVSIPSVMYSHVLIRSCLRGRPGHRHHHRQVIPCSALVCFPFETMPAHNYTSRQRHCAILKPQIQATLLPNTWCASHPDSVSLHQDQENHQLNSIGLLVSISVWSGPTNWNLSM